MKTTLIAITTALTILATPVLAEDIPTPLSGGFINVSGTGIVKLSPDMAIINAGVQSRAKSAKAALADNNAKMAALFAEFEKAGIEAKDLQTSNFNIHPEMVYPKPNENKPPLIVGYIVSNQVTVRIHDLEKIGDVMTTFVDAGANNLSGLQFDVSNRDEKLMQARKEAIADAKAKAAVYAEGIGVKIKRFRGLKEEGSYRPERMMMRAPKMEMAASAVPIAQGEMSISVTIDTTWEVDN